MAVRALRRLFRATVRRRQEPQRPHSRRWELRFLRRQLLKRNAPGVEGERGAKPVSRKSRLKNTGQIAAAVINAFVKAVAKDAGLGPNDTVTVRAEDLIEVMAHVVSISLAPTQDDTSAVCKHMCAAIGRLMTEYRSAGYLAPGQKVPPSKMN